MNNLIDMTEFASKIVLRPNSPFLNRILERIYDKWDTTACVHDRWGTMKKWVDRYKNGASFEEMLSCSEADAYGKWCLSLNAEYTPDNIDDKKKEIVNMIVSIAKGGYSEDKWPKDARWYPIRTSIDGMGLLHTFDGAHRMMILTALGMETPSMARFVPDTFQKAISSLSSLYQPSCHPCVQSLSVNRKDLVRYQVISDAMKNLRINSACEIGCAEGEGLIVLAKSGAKMTGIENEDSRFALAQALCKVTGKAEVKKELKKTQEHDAYIGLSVWHHLGKSLQDLNDWIDLTKHAKFQFVEMPEPMSKTFKQPLIDDTGWKWENVGEEILQYIIKVGKYTKSEILYVDKKYANRKTILISR